MASPEATCLRTESHSSSLGLSSSPVPGAEAKQCLKREPDAVIMGVIQSSSQARLTEQLSHESPGLGAGCAAVP